jgi:amidohydrolase
MGCRAELSLVSSIPAVVNDPEIAAQVHTVVDQLLPDHELDTSERTMGSEDMSVFMERVPGCYIFIGSANTQLGLDAPHHNPRFDFDESVLPEAVALLSSTALQLLAAQ